MVLLYVPISEGYLYPVKMSEGIGGVGLKTSSIF